MFTIDFITKSKLFSQINWPWPDSAYLADSSLTANVHILVSLPLGWICMWSYTNLPLSRMSNILFILPWGVRGSRHLSPKPLFHQALHPWYHHPSPLIISWNFNLSYMSLEKRDLSIWPLKISGINIGGGNDEGKRKKWKIYNKT